MHKGEDRAAVFMLAMKMKVERKGKAYPSHPSASSLSSKSSCKDPDSVLKLLPVTILALALSLPNQDREVLAYLIARSIFITTAPNPSSIVTQNPKSKCKTKSTANKNGKYCDQTVHLFQCGCFDCYTVFWYRWDSSPNRDFIHQVIEAFEEHLVQKIESSKKQSRGKKKGKVLMMGHFESDNILFNIPEIAAPKTECEVMIMQEHFESGEIEENEVVFEEEMVSEELATDLEMEVVTGHASGYNDSNDKGLSRKVLPDAMGLLISRLWTNLWSPVILSCASIEFNLFTQVCGCCFDNPVRHPLPSVWIESSLVGDMRMRGLADLDVYPDASTVEHTRTPSNVLFDVDFRKTSSHSSNLLAYQKSVQPCSNATLTFPNWSRKSLALLIVTFRNSVMPWLHGLKPGTSTTHQHKKLQLRSQALRKTEFSP
ncbi:hypothetical protein SADUNF_Sadunf15G0087200 [Salix dunnii]|uniref:Uncharacterized protein n=1 Tax=Salix dunnii TaxID=1413687 RepID=A0A835JE79_9ROSI|nr:hypothetical protein SADUNF_Sadunf15G0087200 [Salix dunnii]